MFGWPKTRGIPAVDSTRPTRAPKAGPDYGRFIDGVRALQDHARAVDAPDAVITEAADLLDKLSGLLTPYDTDEWQSPSGRRMDLPVRGNILTIPMSAHKTDDGRIEGWARFARFHLGRNGAVHGGSIGMLFDTRVGADVVGAHRRSPAAHRLPSHQLPPDRPDRKELQVDARVDRVEGRKIFVSGRLSDGDTVLTDAEALFVLLKPGQP